MGGANDIGIQEAVIGIEEPTAAGGIEFIGTDVSFVSWAVPSTGDSSCISLFSP